MHANLENEDDKIEAEDDGFEIEIEDDTPEEDRGREPMPEEIVEKLDEDELEEFSKEKAKQLKKVWHDERRAKEAALREREEAVGFARKMYEENQKLKKTLGSGERALMGSAKSSAEKALDIAKREFREAYDSGDVDKVAEAQDKLMEARMELDRVSRYKPQYKEEEEEESNAERAEENTWRVQPVQQTPQPDAKAEAWREKNKWFGENRAMTSYAFGLHEELVVKGVDPTSDDYYDTINAEMRRRFPEEFDGDGEQEAPVTKPKRSATVVAPAKRTTSPRKVKLTATQAQLARKLGLTNEQYAAEVLKLGAQNG